MGRMAQFDSILHSELNVSGSNPTDVLSRALGPNFIQGSQWSSGQTRISAHEDHEVLVT